MRFVLPVLLLAGSPAIGAEQFDLACQGYKWKELGGSGQSYSFTVRIDADAGKWCEGECKPVQDIVSADGDTLVLIDQGTLNTRMEMSREASFDKATNRFHYKYLQNRPTVDYLEYQAECTVQPFTPFP